MFGDETRFVRYLGFHTAAFAVHRAADPTLPDDPRAELQKTYGTLGWLVPRALTHCPPPESIYYDQVAQVVMPRWSRGRVVLVGDSCYAVSLLAGQGAALGIMGAYVLGEQLAAAETPKPRSPNTNGWSARSSPRNRKSRGEAHAGSCPAARHSCGSGEPSCAWPGLCVPTNASVQVNRRRWVTARDPA